jgi:hypothetical protein
LRIDKTQKQRGRGSHRKQQRHGRMKQKEGGGGYAAVEPRVVGPWESEDELARAVGD